MHIYWWLLRGGGTAKGIVDLLNEFDSELVGMGVLVDNVGVKNKSISDYISLINLNNLEENKELEITPSEIFDEDNFNL